MLVTFFVFFFIVSSCCHIQFKVLDINRIPKCKIILENVLWKLKKIPLLLTGWGGDSFYNTMGTIPFWIAFGRPVPSTTNSMHYSYSKFIILYFLHHFRKEFSFVIYIKFSNCKLCPWFSLKDQCYLQYYSNPFYVFKIFLYFMSIWHCTRWL